MKSVRPLLVIGTRPEAIKMAPVIWECRRRGCEVDPVVCLSGQHAEMLGGWTRELGIEPDIVLSSMCRGQSLAALAARCLQQIDETIAATSPDCVAAVGDTTTVMAASLAAFFRQVPFVHIEAGLRTGNLEAPWPEELNRRIAAVAAGLHCAPTPLAQHHLLAEGIPAESIHVTGNTVVDALIHTVARQRLRASFWRAQFPWLRSQRLVLVTAHRRESCGAGLTNLGRALKILAQRFPDTQFVLPLHTNPQVRASLAGLNGSLSNLRMIEPVAYPGFVWLLDRSTLVLTDSGGIQEEAPSLGKPVLVLREQTERREAIESGAAELIGMSVAGIVDATTAVLNHPADYARRQIRFNPFGDGRAAERIVQLIIDRAWELSARRAGTATIETDALPLAQTALVASMVSRYSTAPFPQVT